MLEQAEITIKLVETENLKLLYDKTVQTTTTQIYLISNSDTDLTKKITEILNIYEKNPNFKGKPSLKNGVTIAEDTDIALLNADRNNKTTRINHKVQGTKEIVLSVHEKRSKFTK